MKGTYHRDNACWVLCHLGLLLPLSLWSILHSFSGCWMLETQERTLGWTRNPGSLCLKEIVKSSGVVPERLRIQFKEVLTGQRWISGNISKNYNCNGLKHIKCIKNEHYIFIMTQGEKQNPKTPKKKNQKPQNSLIGPQLGDPQWINEAEWSSFVAVNSVIKERWSDINGNSGDRRMCCTTHRGVTTTI